MTSTGNLTRGLIALGLLVALWVVMLTQGAGNIDRDVLLALYAGDEPWLALAALGFTKLGNWWTVVGVTLAGAAWLFYRRRPWAAVALLLASFGGRLLIIVQKAYFSRLRPEENLWMVEVNYMSFPSGHASNSIVAYLPLALLLFVDPAKRRVAAVCAVVLAFLIGISRPMLGVHWPSDVIAGWAFGLAWVGLVFALMERFKPGFRR